eukprot:scaffold54211_cov54-Phaeocystis_antarctica.AAC.1
MFGIMCRHDGRARRREILGHMCGLCQVLQPGSRGFDDTRSKRSDRKLKAQTRPRESLGGGVVEARAHCSEIQVAATQAVVGAA